MLTEGDQLDVSLPTGRPVVELMPEVLDLLGADPGIDPAVWTLSTVRAGTLDPLSTLGETDVLDGSTVYLTRETDTAAPPFVDDVLAEMTRVVDRDAAVWSGRPRAMGLSVTAVLILTVIASLMALGGGFGAAAWLVVAVACLGAGWCAQPVRDIVPWAAVPVTAAAVWAPMESVATSWRVAFTLTAAATAFSLAAVVARRLRPWAVVGVAVAVVLAVSGAAFVVGANPVAWCAWTTLIVVIGVMVIPRFAVNTSGILLYLRRAESMEMVARDDVHRAVRRGRQTIDAAVWTLAVVATAQMVVLAAAGVWEQGLLGALLAVVVWLRSRSFAHARHAGVLVAAAIIGSVAAALRVPDWAHWDGTATTVWCVAVSLALLVVVIAATTVRPDEVTQAQIRSVVDAVDVPLTLAFVPVLVFAQGIYPYFWPH